MKFKLAIAVAVALCTGLALRADDSRKKAHKCPLEKIMCPFQGACEGQCRTICDKGGEGLAAVHAAVAADVKTNTKKDASACVAGTCKSEECKECAKLNEKVFGPAVKNRVNARFQEMGKKTFHTVKDANGKETKVECTFLTGKLCDECVKMMTKEAIAALADLQKAETK